MWERYSRVGVQFFSRLMQREVAAVSYGSNSADRMLAVIQSLPRRRREAFLMHRFEGLSHAQIAVRMGASRQSVERHVRMALQACCRGHGIQAATYKG